MDDRAELLSLLDACRAEGARAAEVMHQRFERFLTTGMRVRGAQVDEEAWTLRLWLDGGRVGVATGPARKALVSRAMAAAHQAPRSEWAGPADRFAPITGPLGNDDRRFGSVEDEDRNEMLGLAERSLNQGPVSLRRLRYEELRERRSWLSTRDVELSAAATTYTLEAEATLGPLTLGHRIASRHFSNVASLPFGADLRRRMEQLSRPAPVPDESLPMVLEPRAVASFLRSLAPAFAAPAVGAGNLLTGKLGRPLSSTILHVTDDGGLASGLHTWPFDERGVPPIAVPLLKEGVPNSMFHDPESARAAGLRPTGHVRGGRLQASNLIVRPGSRTRNVILSELRNYLVVDELPPVDLATGRVFGRVRLGVVAACERVGTATMVLDLPVSTLLLAVSEVASDQERCGEVDSPSVVCQGLPFG
ncbi:MAG: hypothetical protein EXR71_02570 [Myxococcales bacterium]|nr:hypothetical protein [Myxococcales bacterium]